MKPIKLIIILSVLFLVAGAVSSSAESGPNYTSRMYPGIDGKLIYVPDNNGNTIPDFSNAGYGGGGVPIPYVPVKETVWGVEGDATPVIQAAIDRVSALEQDENGFRGAVLLKAGYYDLNSPLSISASGVVLRGEGQDQLGTIFIGRNITSEEKQGFRGRPPLIAVRGESSESGEGRRFGGPPIWTTDDSTVREITDEYVPVGARSFNVESVKGYKIGDTVLVRRVGNQDWINEIGENLEKHGWKPFTISYDRVITGIQGKTITVDAPIMCAIETQWGGGDVVKYSAPGRISNVGIENLRAMSDFDQNVRQKEYGNLDRHPYVAEEYYSDEQHWWHFMNINNAENCWVKDITGLHFAGNLVGVGSGGKWITIQDCTNLEPVAMRWGARRTPFNLSGQLSLVQRCTSDRGRHSFVLGGYQAAGPNVFLDCTATRSYSSSEPHSHWVTGALFDNVNGPLTARYWKDISIGWSGANIVFWNCVGEFRIQQPPTAQNFTFGHIGVNSTAINLVFQDNSKAEGYMESLDRHVTPGSLYLKQLEDRLGPQAAANIAKN